jgi:hypothetical protein
VRRDLLDRRAIDVSEQLGAGEELDDRLRRDRGVTRYRPDVGGHCPRASHILLSSRGVPVLSLALRSWLRYVAPLTLVSAIVMSPLAIYAFSLDTAHDLATARTHMRTGYAIGAVAWMLQLVLVGGVAPAVFATVGREPGAQIDVLARGLRRALRAVVPCALAVCAIMVGLIAVVVPGLVLLILLSPVAATPSIGEPLPAPLVAAVSAARRDFAAFVIAYLSLIFIDAAIPIVANALVAAPLPAKNASPEALVRATDFVRSIALAFVALSPLPTCAIAAAYANSAPQSQDPAKP